MKVMVAVCYREDVLVGKQTNVTSLIFDVLSLQLAVLKNTQVTDTT